MSLLAVSAGLGSEREGTILEPSISNAIAAHATWAAGLKDQLARKALSPAMKHAGYDDLCDFGRWLYSLDDSVKLTPSYRRVKDLHYRFHQEAALVVVAAAGGDFDSAKQLAGSDFQRISSDLIKAMEAWRAAL